MDSVYVDIKLRLWQPEKFFLISMIRVIFQFFSKRRWKRSKRKKRSSDTIDTISVGNIHILHALDSFGAYFHYSVTLFRIYVFAFWRPGAHTLKRHEYQIMLINHVFSVALECKYSISFKSLCVTFLSKLYGLIEPQWGGHFKYFEKLYLKVPHISHVKVLTLLRRRFLLVTILRKLRAVILQDLNVAISRLKSGNHMKRALR